MTDNPVVIDSDIFERTLGLLGRLRDCYTATDPKFPDCFVSTPTPELCREAVEEIERLRYESNMRYLRMSFEAEEHARCRVELADLRDELEQLKEKFRNGENE